MAPALIELAHWNGSCKFHLAIMLTGMGRAKFLMLRLCG